MSSNTHAKSALLESLAERTRLLEELAYVGQWDHPAWKNASHLAHYDAAAGKCKFADPEARALPEEADDTEMSIPFVISSASQDRDGDVLVPSGLSKWLPAYAKNPVWLAFHDTRLLPIGLACKDKNNKATTCTVKIEDKRIRAVCHFHDQTEMARDCYRLAKAGVLGACSVGFIPHKAQRLKRPERNGGSGPEVDDGIIDFDWPGYRFIEWELAEISLVVIQSNRDAVRLSWEKGIDGSPLGAQARRMIEPYLPARKAMTTGGWRPVEITLAREQFPTLETCDAYLSARGLDASDYAETPTGRVFRQPGDTPGNTPGVAVKSPGEFCRPPERDGNMATETSPADGSTSAGDTGDPMSEKRKVKQVPASAFDALAALFALDAKDLATQAVAYAALERKEADPTGETPTGAATLKAFGELCLAARPANEHPDVVQFLEGVRKAGARCAVKAYPDLALALGYKAEEGEEEEEEPAKKAGGDRQTRDAEDALDAETIRAIEEHNARFTRLTGAHA